MRRSMDIRETATSNQRLVFPANPNFLFSAEPGAFQSVAGFYSETNRNASKGDNEDRFSPFIVKLVPPHFSVAMHVRLHKSMSRLQQPNSSDLLNPRCRCCLYFKENVAIAALFDGHGGPNTAEFAKKRLTGNIVARLKQVKRSRGKGGQSQAPIQLEHRAFGLSSTFRQITKKKLIVTVFAGGEPCPCSRERLPRYGCAILAVRVCFGCCPKGWLWGEVVFHVLLKSNEARVRTKHDGSGACAITVMLLDGVLFCANGSRPFLVLSPKRTLD